MPQQTILRWRADSILDIYWVAVTSNPSSSFSFLCLTPPHFPLLPQFPSPTHADCHLCGTGIQQTFVLFFCFAVPEEVWRINVDVPEEARNVSMDSEDRWYDQVDLTKLILASNQLKALPEEGLPMLPALTVLDVSAVHST